jgi:molecular chaperone DnaJ
MARARDLYALLGVARDAAPDEIRRAFRRLAKTTHPDRQHHESGERFRELRQAFETLRDPERRRAYDEAIRKAEAASHPLTAQPWGMARPPRPRPVFTALAEVVLSPQEAAQGGTLPITAPVSLVCDACDGTGGDWGTCSRCGGSGQIDRALPLRVHIPRGIRDGSVIELQVGVARPVRVLLTIAVRVL